MTFLTGLIDFQAKKNSSIAAALTFTTVISPYPPDLSFLQAPISC
jgi:hypothetical protein